LKILIYSDCFIFGGSENVIENLLKSKILSGRYNLTFYYAFNKRYKTAVDKKFQNFTNVHSIRILSAFNKWGYEFQLKENKSFIRRSYTLMSHVISSFSQKAGVYSVYNLLKLYKLFKNESPDILYINNGGYPGAQSCRMAVLSAKKAGIKNVVFNVNNLALPQKGIIDKLLDKKINAAVKVFVTASAAAKEKLIKQRKFASSKCTNIPNTLSEEKEMYAHSVAGCLRQQFKITGNEIVLGAVGLLTKRKGFDILIEAIHLLIKREKILFKLFIFGEGEYRAILENKVKDYGLEKIVFLPGYKNNMLQYIKDFDVLICPSVANEDFPYVILEGMLLGKPVIGTSIAGIPEQIIDHYNGFIVSPENAAMLADAVGEMISDRRLMQTMGANNYKRYTENFNNTNIIQRYEQLFQSITKKTTVF
jgi:glycosyltransferase involved in cell wall biosynthesis